MAQTTLYVDFPGGPSARVNHAATLDAARYTCRNYMAREWEQVWSKSWLLAGLAADIPEAGDYFVFELGREQIIVTRLPDGGIAALFNACQHRGNRLIAQEWGSLSAFVCPYHNWTYALDGTLLKVPDPERFSRGVPCRERSLKRLRAEVWAGLVFVTMNEDAPPLRMFLGLIEPQLAPYHFERMVLVRDQTVSLDTNWKTVVDNFSELYHVDFMHPQHASFVDCRDATVELWPYGHTGVMVQGYVTNPRYPIPADPPVILQGALQAIGLNPAEFRGRVPEIRQAVQKHKRAIGPSLGFDYGEFSDEQVSDVWQYNLFPNIIMTIKPEELWIMRARPHADDPNKCLFDKMTLQIRPGQSRDAARGLSLVGDPNAVIPPEGARPPREVFAHSDVIAGRHSMTITVDQDIQYLAGMQAGMRSQGFTSAWLNDDESRVQHFHDWLDVWMARES